MAVKSTKRTASNKSVKQAAKKSTVKKQSTIDPSVQILATSKCKTVSGKSDLTYNVGIDDKAQFVLRIARTTGGAFFSREYVVFDSIITALESVPEGKSITSTHLFKVFKGKSQNNPGFLLAVLLAEGILEPLGKKRQYKLSETGVDKFLAKVEQLSASKS